MSKIVGPSETGAYTATVFVPIILLSRDGINYSCPSLIEIVATKENNE
jgi:hypothetical protein